MVHHCFCFILCYCYSQSRAHTVITRSHWHALFYCSLSPHFILARRKNFITLYHDFIVSVLQLRSFVFVFLFYTESLRVSQCKSLFVLFCNVGFCFVFLFCMYLSNVRLLFFLFSFSIYLISRFLLLCFTKFCSLRIYSQKSFLFSLFFVNRLKKEKHATKKQCKNCFHCGGIISCECSYVSICFVL